MIIMLNGSFGVGKTTLAQELANRLPNTMIFDPEIVGAALHYLTTDIRAPEEDTGDFQDLALWPHLTVSIAEQLFRHYRRSLIVPMTLLNKEYLNTIRNGLARISPPLYHFCLVAPLETVERRLRERGDGDPTWSLRKAAEYAEKFYDPSYAVHLAAGDNTTAQLVREVERYISLHPLGWRPPTGQLGAQRTA